MSTSLANTLFSPVVPDWPAGSRPAPPEPQSGEGFDAHLQPAKSAEVARPEKEVSQPESRSMTAESQDSEAETEYDTPGVEISGTDPDPSDEAGDTRHELAEVELPGDVVQSLSGAAAIATVPIEPAVAANTEGTLAVEVDGSLTAVAVDSAQPSATAPPIPALAPVEVSDGSNGPSQDVVVVNTEHATAMIAVAPEYATNTRPFRKPPTADKLAEDTQDAPDVDSPTAQDPREDSRSPVEIRSEPDRLQIASPVMAESATPAARPAELPVNPSGPETTTAGAPITTMTSAEAPRSAMPAEIIAPNRPNAGSVAAAEIDSTRLLHRVARAFAAAAERQGEVTIRLSPPELGSLRLEARVVDGVLTARMQAETPEAQTTILENLSALRERLAEQGVRIERFDVDLMNRQGGQSPHEPFGERRDMPRLARSTAIHHPAKQLADQSSPRNMQVGPGRLNVII
jgi:flagellar hook-length control protein FliK